MDEPLGALDKQLRESLQIEIRRLHAELGITFVYVTHDQEEALTMSDRIAVMNEGSVAQLGVPEDLYNRPVSRFVASFIGESNFLPGIVRGIENGFVVADCAGTVVRAVQSGNSRQGDEVLLSVRPERLRFAHIASDKTAENRICATITDAVFAGERCRYLLQGQGSMPLVLKEPSGLAPRRAPGDTVEIAWAASDTITV